MDLFAAGCNAWAQLDFNPYEYENKDDIFTFTKVASGTTMEKPVSSLVYTIVKVDGRYLTAGSFFDETQAPKAASMAMRGNGDSLHREEGSSLLSLSKNDNRKVRTEEFDAEEPIKEIVAFDTGFAILCQSGLVASMGDARFPEPLGRVPSKDEPAESFIELPDLRELVDDPVKHITACGYAGAALTESGSVYIWGRQPPSRKEEQQFLPDLSNFPNYTEIAGGKDIADIALGETHAIALTFEGEIYVIGNNENGQLGIPTPGVARTWTKLEFYPPPGYQPTGVAAGPHTSFILVTDSSGD